MKNLLNLSVGSLAKYFIKLGKINELKWERERKKEREATERGKKKTDIKTEPLATNKQKNIRNL